MNPTKNPQLLKTLIKTDKTPIVLARLNAERNDYIQLKKMLRDENVTKDLTCLKQIATDCSERQWQGEFYEEATKAFIDGFEVTLGLISTQLANTHKVVLADEIKICARDVTVKNMLIKARG